MSEGKEAARLPAGKAGAGGARRYKPYPAYKDSGVEWLGEIPAHWEVKPLKRVFRVVNGSTPSSAEPAFWDGDIAWVTPEDLGDLRGAVIYETRRSITREGYRSCGTTLVPAGSLVLSTRAPIGHLAVAGVDLCTNQGCRSLVFRRDQSREYFFHELVAARSELESLGQGSTFKELAKGMLEDVGLAEPPEPEQRAIAAFLDRETARIDALVAKKERLIALLEEQRTALITRAVTKGLDPTVPTKDSGVEWLGEIPAHWEVKPLRWAITVRSGEALDNSEFELAEEQGLEVAVIGGNGVMGFTDRANTDTACIAIGRVGALCGNVHLVDPPAWITDNALVASDIRGFERRYLAVLLRVLDLNRWASQNAQPLITGGFVKAQRVCAPPAAEQLAIAVFLDRETARIDALVAKVREAIERLKELRTALISAAVTGKIDVREEVALDGSQITQ